MSYTVLDTPEIVARIEEDLARVSSEVHDGDPHLRSLVLTGGFARGEGAVRGGRPQNDYDLVAIRDPGRTRVPYTEMRRRLESALGLHIDLAPVQTWRLPFVPSSIFWYETALRGRTVFGQDLLHKVPVRSIDRIPPREGLRLLVNRAAGLLFATAQDAAEKRLQASKAVLAALDACLLAEGRFAPSQTERWQDVQEAGAPEGGPSLEWIAWAYAYKTAPDKAPRRDPKRAWRAAAGAIQEAVPVALAHAGYPDLEAYGQDDNLFDHVHYAMRSAGMDRRLARHPTGRVRVATLQMLDEADADHAPPLPPPAYNMWKHEAPLIALERLRSVTLQ